MDLDLARLNHVLIPATKEGRDRFRRSRLGRLLRPAGRLYAALTPEGQVLLGLAAAAAVLGLDVRRSEAHLLAGLLVAAVAASVAVGARFRMPGLRLEVAAPRRVAVGEEVTFTLTCANPGPGPQREVRLRGPFLPYDGAWRRAGTSVLEVPPRGTARAELFARFGRRGEHHLDPFSAGALVPFGLATGPTVQSGGTRLLVIPRLAPVARLALPQGRRYQPGGVALASRTGEALELLGVRPYRAGDAVRDLHARTWARTGAPAVRERQQEFFTRVGVVVDTDRRAAPRRTLEAGLSLAAGVVAHLARGEALIDLLVVGGHVEQLTLGRSLGHLEQALDLLACVEPGPPLEAEALLARLAPHLRRLSCVVLLALAWDAPRRALRDRLEAAGVGCRVLWVGGQPGAEATAVPVPVIEGRGGISL